MNKCIGSFIMTTLIAFLMMLLFELISNYYASAGISLSYYYNHFAKLHWIQYSMYLIASVGMGLFVTVIREVRQDWLKRSRWMRVTVIDKGKISSRRISPRGNGFVSIRYCLTVMDDQNTKSKLTCFSLEHGLTDIDETVDVFVRKHHIMDFKKVTETV